MGKFESKDRSLYDLLGVTPDTSQNDIKAAYRRLAKQHHPDISQSSEATHRMREINYAYSILGDPAKRAAYDAGIRIEEEEEDREYKDSVAYAESFAQRVRCQGCGRFDHTLRIVAFPYIISILIASFKHFAEPGIFCHRCRCNKSLKWAIVSLIFGWWSIWGFFWNIGALIDNFRGGKMPREENAELVAKLAWVNMLLGKIAEAKSALKDLLRYGSNEEALNLKQELDRIYPEVRPARSGGFRLGYLTVVFASLGIYFILAMVLFGGTESISPQSSPPSKPSVVTGESVNLVNYENAGPVKWNSLLNTVEMLLDDVLPYTETNDPGIDSMTMLHNKLEERGVKTGLVSINVEEGEPIHACVAVETTDRGTVFIDLIPEPIGKEKDIERDVYIQNVYIEKGKKIGFLQARYAQSCEYAWYVDYLNELYICFDYYKYVEEFAEVINKNNSRLDSIAANIDNIEYLLYQPGNYSAERENLLNQRIDRYNRYIVEYNKQIEEFMKEVSKLEMMEENFPSFVYWVEETYLFPPYFAKPPDIGPFIIPPALVSPFTGENIDSLLQSDDSYEQIPAPDINSVEKSERYHENNFVVDNYKIKWVNSA